MSLALALLLSQDKPTVIEQVYSCEYLAKESDEPHDPLRVDLTLRHRANGSSKGRWIIEWPGKKPIEAEPFDAKFGSVGGSASFRWIDSNGTQQTGFLSFSDLPAGGGKTAAWLGLGKPSLWQAPGYICAV